jgi:RNA-directed DNA polymerase
MSDKSYPNPTRLFTQKNLLSIWQGSKDSKGSGGAPGLDRITAQTFSKSLDKHFRRISDDAKAGEFKFQPLRAIHIPKDESRYRIICIPTVRDRLVQRVILNYLTHDKNRERDLLNVRSPNSYGGAKGREQGTHAAIDEAIKRRQKQPFVLKTDISKFFDNIPREYLLQQIKSQLGRRSVVPLLEQVIRCEVKEKNAEQSSLISQSGIVSGKGLRQGMPLSPLLSNLVLRRFDLLLAKLGKQFLRYVDDLVVFEDCEADCRETFKLVEDELQKLSLSIPGLDEVSSKSEIRSPDQDVVFLGLSIYRQKNGDYAKRIPAIAFSDLSKRIDTDVTFENFESKKTRSSKNFNEYVSWFDSMKLGYCAAYSGATNLDAFEQHITKLTADAKNKLLKQVFPSDVLDTLDDRARRFIGLK